MTAFAVGSTVVVRHESGTEAAVVQGSSRPAVGERPVYTVRFADGTISSWPEWRVTSYQPEELP